MARVKAVNISLKRGTIKQQMDQVELVENYGIEGDAHAGDWHRQVSLLDQSSVDRMLALGAHGFGIQPEPCIGQGIDFPEGTLVALHPLSARATPFSLIYKCLVDIAKAFGVTS